MSNTDAKIQALKEIAIAHIHASATHGLGPRAQIEHEGQASAITSKIEEMANTTTAVVAKPQETKEQMWWTVTQVARFTPGAAGYVSQAEALSCVNTIMSLEKQLADVKSEMAAAYATAQKATEMASYLERSACRACRACGFMNKM